MTSAGGTGSGQAHGEERTSAERQLAEPTLKWSLQAFCQLAVDALGVDHSGFVRFNSSFTEGTVAAHYPEKGFEGLVGRTIPLAGVPIEDQLLQSNAPLEIRDVEDAARDLAGVAPLLREFRIRSLFIVKVIAHGRPIGSFSLDRRTPHQFTEHERAVTASLAALASVVVEHSELADWLNAFGAATEQMVTPEQPSELPAVIASLARELFDVDEAGLYERVYDAVEGEEYLRLVATTADRPAIVLRRRDKGMAWKVIDSGVAFEATTDYGSYPDRAQTLLDTKQHFGAVLEVPLKWRDEPVGVFFLNDKLGRTFTSFDAELVQRFADMAVLAMQRARLHARIRQLSEESAIFSGGLGAFSLRSRLRAIALAATKILNAEMCGIFGFRKPGVLVLEASVGHRTDMPKEGEEFSIIDGPASGLTGAIAYRLMNVETGYLLGTPAPVFNEAGDQLRSDPAVRSPRQRDASPSGQCHSLMAVMLTVTSKQSRRFLGMLRVSNKRCTNGKPSDRCRFSAEDAWILELLARAAAVAVEGAELVEALDDSRTRLVATRDAVALTAGELVRGRFASALGFIVQGLATIVGCDSADLVTVLPGVPTPVLDHTSHGLTPIPGPQWLGQKDNSVIGRIVRAESLGRANGEMHVASDAASDHLMSGAFVAREHVVSSVALRLWIEPGASTAARQLDLSQGARGTSKVCVGVLFLNYRQRSEISDEVETIIELFGRLAAITIHERQTHHDTAIELQVRRALYRAARELASSMDVDSTYQRITDQAFAVASALGRSVKFVDIVTGDAASSTVMAASPAGEVQTIATTLAAYRGSRLGLVARCLRTRATVLVNDVRADTDYIPVHSETLSELVLFVKDEHSGQLLGAINIESSELQGFQPRDVQFFELYSLLAADAIRNANRYAELRRTQYQREQLRQLLLYYVRTGVVAHKYRRLLSDTAKVVSDVLTRAPVVPELAILRDLCEQVIAQSSELAELLSPTGFDPNSWRSQDLADTLGTFVETIRANSDFTAIHISYDPAGASAFEVSVDAPMFRHVLEIFFRNSLESLQRVRYGRIYVSTTREDSEHCLILIEDNGQGMTQERWDNVLEGPVTPGDAGGSGMGLALARIIVNAFGGEVRKIRSDPAGTAFGIVLPHALNIYRNTH